MIKKIFIISSILLLLALVFFGVYNFAFRDIESLKKSKLEKENKNSEIIKKTEEKKIFELSEAAILGATVNREKEKIVFYRKDNGNVENVSFDGSIKSLVFENNINGLKNVLWSPNKNFVISEFGDGQDKKYYLYNYLTKKATELKKGIDGISWDNQGGRIIYKYFDANSGERSLNIADPDGTNWEKLIALDERFKKMSFAHVPQSLFISFWNYPNAFEETSLNKVNVIGEHESQEVLKGKFGADYLWSPDGRSFLVSSVDKGGSNLKLEIGSADSLSYLSLELPTLAEKCAWSKDSKYAYCSLPASLPVGAVMPNDYQDKKFFTQDSFWKIELETGKKERIIELEELNGSYDASNLFLSPAEDVLFFTNRESGKLYGITL